jgi:hypothetical protein
MSATPPPPPDTATSQRAFWWGVIVGVLLFAFCLGLPQFHYAAALMVAVILRYKDEPAGALPFGRFAAVATPAPAEDVT